MAQPGAAAPAVNVNIDREQTKIPLFHADPKQDSFQPEYWIDRLVRLKTANAWTDAQTTCNAINSLRGRSLHFVDFLEESFGDQNPSTNWNLFKEQFLLSFGKKARDTSSVANLAVMQRDSETVQLFAHRVVVTTREFFQAMNAPDEPNFQVVAANPAWAALAQDEQTQQMVRFFTKETAKTIRSFLNKTIFLNGIKKEINALVKNTHPTSWLEAVENAIKIDRNMKGPIDHTIALEKDKSAASINYIKRGGASTRGRGRGYAAGNGQGRGHASKSSATRANMECWYCRKPGHPQIHCRKRIARGADMVSRPKSVAEITAEDIGYQDGSDQDENDLDAADDREDYLEDTLNDAQEHLDAICIATLHLNEKFRHLN